MLSKYSRDQWLIIVASIVFIIGGILMLVNTFGGHEWAFYVSLGIMVLASAIVVLAWIDNKKRVAKNLENTKGPKKEVD